MKQRFNQLPFPYVAVSNAVWLCGNTAIIQAYSFRTIERLTEMVELVKTINNLWHISNWCFDWSAECSLTVYYDKGNSYDIFEGMFEYVFKPLYTTAGINAANIHMIHGDADITIKYVNRLDSLIEKGYKAIGTVTHVNKFFWLYRITSWPTTTAVNAAHKKFSTFNLRRTLFRSELYNYLEKNNLLDQGHCNFAFNNYCNIHKKLLTRTYGDNNGRYEKNEELFLSYYKTSNFDIVMETASDTDNQRFITEKTIRALAHGQPFVVHSGYHTLELLRSYGFRTYDTVWNESYDSIINPFERFGCLTDLIAHLINSDIFETHRSQLDLIGQHNRARFLEISGISQEEIWYKAAQAGKFHQSAIDRVFLTGN